MALYGHERLPTLCTYRVKRIAIELQYKNGNSLQMIIFLFTVNKTQM